MRNDRFQNHVAESVFTLPVCVVLATLMWYLSNRIWDIGAVLGWGVCAITTYVVMETNTVQYLIRIRTRMMACIWLALWAVLPFLHTLGAPILCAMCLSIAYYLLFRCYQLPDATPWVFHCFLFLGFAGLCVPLLLCMSVLFYVYLAVLMRSLSWRSLWAGIIGLFLPWWGWTVWCMWTGNWDMMTSHFLSTWDFQWPDIECYSISEVSSWAFVSLLSFVGFGHFMQTRYNDKIQIRMMLYVYVIQFFAIQILILLCPIAFHSLMAVLLLTGAPLIAHYFSLTGSWLSNAFFVLSLLGFVALAFLNLWPESVVQIRELLNV